MQSNDWRIRPDNWAEMTREQRTAWMFAHTPPIPPRPVERKPEVTLEVSPKLADTIVANPKGVRVAVSGEVTVVERARPIEIVEVVRVDAGGRPSLIRRVDCTTGHASMIEMNEGYRAGGAKHEYNPLDALRRD
jgi:hypothetical protein